MIIKITLLVTFLIYAFIAGQSFFYMLAFSNVTKKLGAAAWIEATKLINTELQLKLSLLYYAALCASILLTSFSVVNPNGILFISSVIALVSLVADIAFAWHGNRSINKIINSWSVSTYPENWQHIRSKWFSVFHSRQVVNIFGFVSLSTGTVFGL